MKIPAAADQGVRLSVQTFVLEGVVDHPQRGITRAELERRAEESRKAHPEGFTISELQAVTDEITRVYRTAGYILARAFVPEQEVVDGRVIIRVLEGRLDQVSFQKNRRYSDEVLARPFEELIGDPVSSDEIERALLELDDYPSLSFSSVFTPGDTAGTAKLIVDVESEKWADGAVWLDNYGSENTGEYRLWVEAGINNPTGGADRLSAQILTTFDEDDGNSDFYSLDYWRPVFSSRYLFSLGASRNAFDVGGDFAEVDLRGQSTTMAISLRRNFVRGRQMKSDGLIALTSKRSSTELSSFSLGEDALTVVSLSPKIEFRDRWSGYNQAYLFYSAGLPGVLGAMDEEGDGKSSRNGDSGRRAGGDFTKINLHVTRWQPLLFSPAFRNQTVVARFQMQRSDDLLVSMEQMSLGGPNSVRAYPPSEQMVDEGVFFSLEWIARAGAVAKGLFLEDLQFSLFYDYADGELNHPLDNDSQPSALEGWGASLQFAPEGKYRARLELASPISNPEPSNKRDLQYFFKFGYQF